MVYDRSDDMKWLILVEYQLTNILFLFLMLRVRLDGLKVEELLLLGRKRLFPALFTKEYPNSSFYLLSFSFSFNCSTTIYLVKPCDLPVRLRIVPLSLLATISRDNVPRL